MKKILLIFTAIFLMSFYPMTDKEYIKCTRQHQADSLNVVINNLFKEKIAGYNATKWCNPIKHRFQDIWLIETGEGARYDLIMLNLSNIDLITVSTTDTNYFKPSSGL